jgi:hypothetical protein
MHRVLPLSFLLLAFYTAVAGLTYNAQPITIQTVVALCTPNQTTSTHPTTRINTTKAAGIRMYDTSDERCLPQSRQNFIGAHRRACAAAVVTAAAAL